MDHDNKLLIIFLGISVGLLVVRELFYSWVIRKRREHELQAQVLVHCPWCGHGQVLANADVLNGDINDAANFLTCEICHFNYNKHVGGEPQRKLKDYRYFTDPVTFNDLCLHALLGATTDTDKDWVSAMLRAFHIHGGELHIQPIMLDRLLKLANWVDPKFLEQSSLAA